MSPNIEPMCDYCVTTLAVIYCKSDLAKLCLNCDNHVHSANPLSQRHTRSLICQKCLSQPAVIRCLDDKISYCQGCHWHASNCSVLGHRLQSLNPFSGCPSPTVFVRMWSSILDPSVSGLVSPFVGSLPLNDPNNAMFRMVKINEIDRLIDYSYSMVPHNINYIQNLSDQSSFFSLESKVLNRELNSFDKFLVDNTVLICVFVCFQGCPDLILKLEEGEEDLCEGLNLDNAPLNFDVGDDIIRCSSEEHIEPHHTVPNCLLVDKNNTSVIASNFTIDKASEVSLEICCCSF